jgi:hypothetical protein
VHKDYLKTRKTTVFGGFFVSISIDTLGGDEGDRTLCLLNAIQALSQVSYTPMKCRKASFILYEENCLVNTISQMRHLPL